MGGRQMQNWLSKQANLVPHRLALIAGKQSWTFSELQRAVYRLAGQLTSLQLQKEKHVAILVSNRPESYQLILALQQLGVVPVLLNYRLAGDELRRQLIDANVQTVIVDDHLKKYQVAWGALARPTYQLADILITRVAQPKISQEFDPKHVASIMYTSGTTGNPHGVKQTFDNHFYSAIGSALNLGVAPTDRWLCAVPLFHISGLSIMMRSLVYGMPVQLVNHFDTAEVTALLCNEPITIMSVVPTMLKRLLACYPASGYNQLFRTFLLGGGPIDKATLAQCQKMALPVIQSYGMTESASQIVALSFADAPHKIGSAGKPLMPVQMRVQAPITQVGAIEIKAPNITPGYVGDQAAFKQKLTADGWYQTGDLGYLDNEGFLYVKGRDDDMFISGGENVFPDEIEQVYSKAPGIMAISVIGVDHPQWGQIPVAYVVAQAGVFDEQQLVAYGREHLAHYKVPKTFIQLEKLPTTASGKVQRHKLRTLYQTTFS